MPWAVPQSACFTSWAPLYRGEPPLGASSVCPQRPGACGGPALPPAGVGAELQCPRASEIFSCGRQTQGPVSGGPGGVLRLRGTLGR